MCFLSFVCLFVCLVLFVCLIFFVFVTWEWEWLERLCWCQFFSRNTTRTRLDSRWITITITILLADVNDDADVNDFYDVMLLLMMMVLDPELQKA